MTTWDCQPVNEQFRSIFPQNPPLGYKMLSFYPFRHLCTIVTQLTCSYLNGQKCDR